MDVHCKCSDRTYPTALRTPEVAQNFGGKASSGYFLRIGDSENCQRINADRFWQKFILNTVKSVQEYNVSSSPNVKKKIYYGTTIYGEAFIKRCTTVYIICIGNMYLSKNIGNTEHVNPFSIDVHVLKPWRFCLTSINFRTLEHM